MRLNLENIILFDALVAYRVVDAVQKFRWITPNGVTLVSLVFGVLSGVAIMIFANPVLAAAFLVLARWLDHVDGGLARATGRESGFGAFFDLATGAATFACLNYAIAVTVTENSWVIWGAAAFPVAIRVLEIMLGWIIGRARGSERAFRGAGELYFAHSGPLLSVYNDECGALPYWTFPLFVAIGAMEWFLYVQIGGGIAFAVTLCILAGRELAVAHSPAPAENHRS